MLLVVDVGNTQTHFGVIPAGAEEVARHWRFATVRESTGDELGAALANLLALRSCRSTTWMRRSSPRPCRSSPSSGRRWRSATSVTRCSSSGPTIKTGMPIRIDNPYEVGADRLVNAVAAYERVRDACVVVDFGTAITYDAVSPAGEYLGGIITPGAEISIDALYERAAKLPKVELAEPRSLIGKSTVDAIRCGIVFGFAGQVEAIVKRLRDELGADDARDRDRRARGRARPVHPRDDRRGRRDADADRAAADLGAQSVVGSGGDCRHGDVRRLRNRRREDQERHPPAIVRVLGEELVVRVEQARGSRRTPARRRSRRGRRRRAARARASRGRRRPGASS